MHLRNVPRGAACSLRNRGGSLGEKVLGEARRVLPNGRDCKKGTCRLRLGEKKQTAGGGFQEEHHFVFSIVGASGHIFHGGSWEEKLHLKGKKKTPDVKYKRTERGK